MSKLKIDLNDWRERVQDADPEKQALKDIDNASDMIFLDLQEKDGKSTSSDSDKTETKKSHPQLVAALAIACAINRRNDAYCILKIEELRLLKSVDNSLERIADAMESAKGNLGSQSLIDSTDIFQICDSMHKSSGDMLEGCTRIAKAIEEITGAIERKDDE